MSRKNDFMVMVLGFLLVLGSVHTFKTKKPTKTRNSEEESETDYIGSSIPEPKPLKMSGFNFGGMMGLNIKGPTAPRAPKGPSSICPVNGPQDPSEGGQDPKFPKKTSRDIAKPRAPSDPKGPTGSQNPGSNNPGHPPKPDGPEATDNADPKKSKKPASKTAIGKNTKASLDIWAKSSKPFRIQSPKTQLFLTVKIIKQNILQVFMGPATNFKSQLWTVSQDAKGLYYLHNFQLTNYVLEVEDIANKNGASVFLAQKCSKRQQLWTITFSRAGYFGLQSVFSSLFLDAGKDGEIFMTERNKLYTQLFGFVEVTEALESFKIQEFNFPKPTTKILPKKEPTTVPEKEPKKEPKEEPKEEPKDSDDHDKFDEENCQVCKESRIKLEGWATSGKPFRIMSERGELFISLRVYKSKLLQAFLEKKNQFEAQLWTVERDASGRYFVKNFQRKDEVLEVEGDCKPNDASVLLSAKSGKTSQQWGIRIAYNGAYVFSSISSYLMMDGKKNGDLKMAAQNKYMGQRFRFVDVTEPLTNLIKQAFPFGSGDQNNHEVSLPKTHRILSECEKNLENWANSSIKFSIRPSSSRLVFSTVKFQKYWEVHMKNFNNFPTQFWTLENVEKNVYTIRNHQLKNEVLTIQDMDLSPGAKLISFPHTGKANQKFIVTCNPNNTYTFEALHSGLVLDAGPFYNNIGAAVGQKEPSNSPSQKLFLIPY